MDENQTLSTKQSTPQKRQPAKIIHIKDIHDGVYVKQEGWEPNFIKSTFGEEIHRVNIIAVVVEPPLAIEGMTQFSCTVDDGTSKIELRAFEEIKIDGNLDIGTPVLIIGKPREYNNIYYILPEIIRPIEKEWVEFRQKELKCLDTKRDQIKFTEKKTDKNGDEEPSEPNEQNKTSKKVNEPVADFSGVKSDEEDLEDVDEDLDDTEEQATPALLEIIDKLDEGDGVLVTDLEAKFDDAEEKVTRLLLHGEVYEIKPGRIKVLK